MWEDNISSYGAWAIVLPFGVETYHYHSAQGVNLANSNHEDSFLS